MRSNYKICLSLLFSTMFIFGCATSVKRNPLPEAYGNIAQIPYIHEARYWGDDLPPNLQERIYDLKEQISGKDPQAKIKPVDYLAISGGGADGAFGAGLLVGWSESGDRPEFRMVTGISTGALIAPFVFLGPKYDKLLKEFYTTTSTKNILKWPFSLDFLFEDALASSEPLKQILTKIINGKLLQAIALEHDKGRRLLIGTTNLDAERPVIWNIGAIAKSGAPNALELVRAVLLASASIPGLFPPVYIEVEADGQHYDEMHVDGGTSAQVFAYPVFLDLGLIARKVGLKGKNRIYVIRNARIDPKWETVKPGLTQVTNRSISLLIRTQGIGDLQRIYFAAERDGVDFNLAFIPKTFNEKSKELFDPDYMSKLFDLGHQMAINGYPWQKFPPEFKIEFP